MIGLWNDFKTWARQDPSRCVATLISVALISAPPLAIIYAALPFGQNHNLLRFLTAAAIVYALPLYLYQRSRTQRQIQSKIQNKICLTCGYNCQATPTRCPECGHPPATVKFDASE